MMKYYVFEGADGTGKSTIAKKVYNKLKDNHNVKYIYEPAGEIRKAIMSDVKEQSELLLFFADRINQFSDIKEDIVIADRSFISSYIYQHKYRCIADIDQFNWLLDYSMMFSDLKPIDKLFVFNTSKRFGEKENRMDETNREEISEYYSDLKTDPNINNRFNQCINIKNIEGQINEITQQCVLEILKDLRR